MGHNSTRKWRTQEKDDRANRGRLTREEHVHEKEPPFENMRRQRRPLPAHLTRAFRPFPAPPVIVAFSRAALVATAVVVLLLSGEHGVHELAPPRPHDLAELLHGHGALLRRLHVLSGVRGVNWYVRGGLLRVTYCSRPFDS